MRAKGLVQAIIGGGGFVLEDISANAEMNEIYLAIRPTNREQCRCGICHRKAARYDKGRGRRRWRCLDMGAQKVYVEAEQPRVNCPKHGVVTAAVPWARHGNRFTKGFEDEASWLSVHANRSIVSEFLRVEWHTVHISLYGQPACVQCPCRQFHTRLNSLTMKIAATSPMEMIFSCQIKIELLLFWRIFRVITLDGV